MVFSSLEFIFLFLPAFMIVYGVVPTKYKNATIFAGSVFFYSMGVLERPIYIVLFLLSDIFPDRLLVESHCTYIISFCPKVPVAEFVFQIRMFFKHHQSTLSLEISHET